MKQYYQMYLSELLAKRQILSAQYNLCLSYYLASDINFYLYQADHYMKHRDCIDVVLDEVHHINGDNLCVSNDLLSQFSCN